MCWSTGALGGLVRSETHFRVGFLFGQCFSSNLRMVMDPIACCPSLPLQFFVYTGIVYLFEAVNWSRLHPYIQYVAQFLSTSGRYSRCTSGTAVCNLPTIYIRHVHHRVLYTKLTGQCKVPKSLWSRIPSSLSLVGAGGFLGFDVHKITLMASIVYNGEVLKGSVTGPSWKWQDVTTPTRGDSFLASRPEMPIYMLY